MFVCDNGYEHFIAVYIFNILFMLIDCFCQECTILQQGDEQVVSALCWV